MSGELTSKQQQAAMLEAAGFSRQDIARTEIASTATVSRWRREQAYKDAVASLKDAQGAALEPLVHKVRIDLLQAIEEAVQALRDALKSDDADLVVRAANSLVGRFKDTGFGAQEQGGAQATAQAAVIVVGADALKRADQDPEAPIDAESVEVVS